MGKWSNWKPLDDTSIYYYIESIIDSPNGFEVILANSNPKIKNDNQRVKIYFDGWVDAFRYTDEGLRLELWNKLDKKHETKFRSKKNFFKVENSEYLKWIDKESLWYIDAMKPTHYVIMDNECVLDIVATYEPTVELIKKTERNLTSKRAFFAMFDFLSKYHEKTGKHYEIGNLLSEISLLSDDSSKIVDSEIWKAWLKSTEKIKNKIIY